MNELRGAKLTVEINRLEKEANELEIRARNDERPQSITVNNNMAKDLRKKAGFLLCSCR